MPSLHDGHCTGKRRCQHLTDRGSVIWVKCRSPLDPVDFKDDDGQGYFDPTNDIYARGFYLVCDDVVLGERFRTSSIGELREAWLGLGCMRQLRDDHASKQMCRLASWIDELVFLVFVLFKRMKLHAGIGPKPWALRVRSMLRSEAGLIVFEDVVTHPRNPVM